MDASLLFRKKAALIEDGLDWLKGSDEFPYTAKRNPTGRAAVSAILVRALLTVAEGQCREAHTWATGLAARVVSKSTPGATAWCWNDQSTFALPHGEANKVTYHLGVLWILQALRAPLTAVDFWTAYHALLEATQRHGRAVAIKPALVRAADELYYFGRYADAPPDAGHDQLAALTIADALKGAPPTGEALDLAPLTDLRALEQLTSHRVLSAPTATLPDSPPGEPDSFVGWQLPALREALQNGWNVLLAGPTGTGKSLAVQQAVLADSAALVTIEGKEGLTDLDFLGAILPRTDGSRRWVDGPLLRALRQAQFEPVALFLDEVNRIRREHLNLLLGLMNPKPAALCARQGLAVEGDGPFYIIEVPLTSEVVWCPSAHLRIVAAGNFGSEYAVYPLDPAVRRRFDVVLDFDYLPLEQELALVQARCVLEVPTAKALCLVAHYTRQMRRNGDLPGCVDTASLLQWARLCAQHGATTAHEVMRLGLRVWADLACGRDHLGLVRQAKFDGLTDYLLSQNVLPAGDARRTSGGRAHFLPRA